VSWANLTTKNHHTLRILQFCSRGFSFAVRVIKWLLVHLEIFGGKCVSSMKKCIFISLEKCFCTDFCEFFEFIFDCTISKRRDRIRALLSLPRVAYKRAEKFQDGSLLNVCHECRAVKLTMYVTHCIYSYPLGRPWLGLLWAPQDIAIIP
jgi:hypothetical protein